MTTYLDQSDEDFPEQYGILKPTHVEDELGVSDDDRVVDADFEDEYSDRE